jgi:hypothetical protein
MWIEKMFRVEKKIETPSDQKLEEIKNILFPPLKLEEEVSREGDTIKFHIDYSIDTNLDAVLIDLIEGNNDAAVQKTLNNMIAKLIQVRKILDTYPELNEEAKYIIVDDGEDKKEVEI